MKKVLSFVLAMLLSVSALSFVAFASNQEVVALDQSVNDDEEVIYNGLFTLIIDQEAYKELTSEIRQKLKEENKDVPQQYQNVTVTINDLEYSVDDLDNDEVVADIYETYNIPSFVTKNTFVELFKKNFTISAIVQISYSKSNAFDPEAREEAKEVLFDEFLSENIPEVYWNDFTHDVIQPSEEGASLASPIIYFKCNQLCFNYLKQLLKDEVITGLFFNSDYEDDLSDLLAEDEIGNYDGNDAIYEGSFTFVAGSDFERYKEETFEMIQDRLGVFKNSGFYPLKIKFEDMPYSLEDLSNEDVLDEIKDIYCVPNYVDSSVMANSLKEGKALQKIVSEGLSAKLNGLRNKATLIAYKRIAYDFLDKNVNEEYHVFFHAGITNSLYFKCNSSCLEQLKGLEKEGVISGLSYDDISSGTNNHDVHWGGESSVDLEIATGIEAPKSVNIFSSITSGLKSFVSGTMNLFISNISASILASSPKTIMNVIYIFCLILIRH